MRKPLLIAVPVLLASLGLVLTACGGSSSPASSSAPTSSSPSPTSTAAAKWMTTDCAIGEPVPSDTSDFSETVGATGVRVNTVIDASIGGVLPPKVAIEADLAPVTGLISIDLLEGAGDPVKPGAAVTVNYCGLGQTTRTMFDASWIRGEPASFGLNQVIPGWTEGIPGMKPGGRRLLIIPGALAYGPNPPTSAILPDETLIFVVDLISSAK